MAPPKWVWVHIYPRLFIARTSKAGLCDLGQTTKALGKLDMRSRNSSFLLHTGKSSSIFSHRIFPGGTPEKGTKVREKKRRITQKYLGLSFIRLMWWLALDLCLRDFCSRWQDMLVVDPILHKPVGRNIEILSTYQTRKRSQTYSLI